MAAARPFEDVPALLRIAERDLVGARRGRAPRGVRRPPADRRGDAPPRGDAAWSAGEQRAAQAAADHVLAELAEANRAYSERHGFMFIVCATGRSAEAMLADLRARLPSSLADELRTAAEEQIEITRLRLHKLLAELA